MRRCSTSIRSQMEWCREKLTQGSINCKEDMYHMWYISSFCCNDLLKQLVKTLCFELRFYAGMYSQNG